MPWSRRRGTARADNRTTTARAGDATRLCGGNRAGSAALTVDGAATGPARGPGGVRVTQSLRQRHRRHGGPADHAAVALRVAPAAVVAQGLAAAPPRLSCRGRVGLGLTLLNRRILASPNESVTESLEALSRPFLGQNDCTQGVLSLIANFDADHVWR